jgi:hypothetical protein
MVSNAIVQKILGSHPLHTFEDVAQHIKATKDGIWDSSFSKAPYQPRLYIADWTELGHRRIVEPIPSRQQMCGENRSHI